MKDFDIYSFLNSFFLFINIFLQ